jgi:hypothetical protein
LAKKFGRFLGELKGDFIKLVVMSLESRKINLAQLLFTVQKESILDKVEDLLRKESSTTFSKQQKKAIDEGLDSPTISHEQVQSETKNKYPNLFK